MNIFKEIKAFKEYRKSIRCHTIDLTPDMKRKLEAFDYSTAKAVFNLTLDRLSKEMLEDNLSPEYVRGATFALTHFKKHFK